MTIRGRGKRRVVSDLIHRVGSIILLLSACKSANSEVWGSSTSSFSLARELANGTSSIIVVPGNHTVAGEFDDKAGEPIQLTRWGQGLA